MTLATQVLSAVILMAAVLILLVLLRPRLIRRWEGRSLVFFAFCVLPLLASYGGGQVHMAGAKQTSFCLSCHEMEPYGRSLRIDSEADGHLPALHFQNNWVPREQACFTCHTEYTLFGGVQAKLRGLNHVWVHYVTGPPDEIALYTPYRNQVCLHCHGGARRFEARSDHAEVRADLGSEALACTECHEYVHDVRGLDSLERWEPGSRD